MYWTPHTGRALSNAGAHQLERIPSLHILRSLAVAPLLILFGFCCGSIVGCGDDSKTTGTRLEMSPEAKAEIEDMRSIMREERAGRGKAPAKKVSKETPAPTK